MKEKNVNISAEKSNENVITVRGEGNNKSTARRVALRRAEETAGGQPFDILNERYSPQGTDWWCFLTISF